MILGLFEAKISALQRPFVSPGLLTCHDRGRRLNVGVASSSVDRSQQSHSRPLSLIQTGDLTSEPLRATFEVGSGDVGRDDERVPCSSRPSVTQG